ncbi:hypothetical protein BN844_3235 [Pseudomonas sp. SHC52]|nr:hypothetical protein BN844_3235 [Pseudomonas sp. SHC52]
MKTTVTSLVGAACVGAELARDESASVFRQTALSSSRASLAPTGPLPQGQRCCPITWRT